MLSKEQIKHIATLARLELSEAEELKYSQELSNILNYIDKLSQVNTDKVLITSQIGGLVNSWREDRVKPWDKDEVALALAQGETSGGQVKVKRVL
ncbi:MAG: Asp-tRNA(Asn)/Glu-tRNA(Gln) amidotransferase subunit GatC [Candidatus Falkowbacteria bacterium]